MVIGSFSLIQYAGLGFQLNQALNQQRYDESKQPVKRPSGWQRGLKPHSFPGRKTTPAVPAGIKSSIKKGVFSSSRGPTTAVL